MTSEHLTEALDRLAHQMADEASDGSDPEPYSAEWLRLRSLQGLQGRLLAEREAAGDAELEVRLVGGAVLDHDVDAGFFGDFIKHFQTAVLAAAQKLIDEDVQSGPFSSAVRELAALRLGPTVPGSFVAPLIAPPRSIQRQFETDREGEEDDTPVADEAINIVLQLLTDPGPGDGEKLIETAGAAGARTVAQVRKLTQRLRVSQTAVKFTHRPPLAPEPRVVTVRPPTAARIEKLLSSASQSVSDLRVEGRLVGASWPRKTFELEVDLGDEGAEIFRGSVPISLRREVSNSFDETVAARLEVTTTSVPGRPDNRTYRLVGLSSPSGGTLDI